MPLKTGFLLPLAAFTAMSLPAFAAAKPNHHKGLAHATAPAHATRKGAKTARVEKPSKHEKLSRHEVAERREKPNRHEKPAKLTKAEARRERRSGRHEKQEAPESPRMSHVKAGRHPHAEAAPEPVARVSKPAEVPQNVQDTSPPAAPAVVTHHDRHVHLTPAPNIVGTLIVPLGMVDKATSADFLTAATTPVSSQATVAPAPLVKSAAPIVRVQKAVIAPVLSPVAVPKPVAVKALIPVISIPYTPLLYNDRGHLIVPAALKGSHEILLHQNEMADKDGLERVQDDEDLERMRALKLLVGIPDAAGLEIDERLPSNRRYVRPWTAAFLSSIAKAHEARFHSSLQVNSAVRTVEFQLKLMRTNGNAAPAEGSTASPHLTGQAVDLAKHGLSMTEIAWMRGFLLPLEQEGKIDVEEEFQQACFHISVYRKFVPQAAPKREIEGSRRRTGTSLAAAIE